MTAQEIRQQIEQQLLKSGQEIGWIDLMLKEYKRAIIREFDEFQFNETAFGCGANDEVNDI